MDDARLEGHEVAREDRAAHLGFLHGGENRHALELQDAKQSQPEACAIDSISSTPGIRG